MSNSHIFSLSYSFGIETKKYVPRLRSSLENHTRFQTKMDKVYTRFQTKTAQKPYPMGRHIPILLIYVSTPPPRGATLSDAVSTISLRKIS